MSAGTRARAHGGAGRRRDRRPASWARAVVVLVPLCLGAPVPSWSQCPDGTPPPCAVRPYHAPAPPPNSVAVLYFDNLSRDTSDAYLADGLTEELIIRLSQVARLRVSSRFESLRVRGHDPSDPRALGRALGAAYLVTGSLQQAGRRVRLGVSLVRASSGATVWGDVYDRTGGDLLEIQSDIASAVARAIVGQLLPDERASLARRPTSDPLAYRFFLSGLGAANTVSENGLRTGLEFFDRAIERDSSFALAYAWKANAWVMLADGYVPGREGYAEVRTAAEEALQRDSSVGLAYAMLSQAVDALDLDAPRAIALGERAVRLAPRDAWGHVALGNALLLGGARDSALRESRRAWEADTLSPAVAIIWMWTAYMAGRLDTMTAALPRLHGALGAEDAAALEGLRRFGQRDFAGALPHLTWRYYGGIVAGEEVATLVALGRPDAARAVTDSMAHASASGYYNAYAVAKAWAALGNADSAFAWLERAHEQRTIWFTAVAVDPVLAPLYGDARWPAFLRRIGVVR